MIQTSEQINEIAAALAKAQATLENVPKDGENPHFRSRYATLAGVLDEARPKLAAQGISIYQAPINGEGNNIGVVTRLLHSSGQWLESTLYVAPTRYDAQGAGSVISYLRRYTLMAVVGIGQDDDDANAAIGKPQARPQTSSATRTAEAASPPPASTSSRQIPDGDDAKKRQAREARDRIAIALEKAETPKLIDEIIKINGRDLETIKEVGPQAYENLMTLANGRKSEMFGATG